MAGKIIMWVVCFGCGILFYSIGVYAQRSKKPMWFWSGTEVKPWVITDVKSYNKENALMWKLYSLWYFAAGVAEIWNSVVATVLLVASFVVGFPVLIATYDRIYKKYRSGQ